MALALARMVLAHCRRASARLSPCRRCLRPAAGGASGSRRCRAGLRLAAAGPLTQLRCVVLAPAPRPRGLRRLAASVIGSRGPDRRRVVRWSAGVSWCSPAEGPAAPGPAPFEPAASPPLSVSRAVVRRASVRRRRPIGSSCAHPVRSHLGGVPPSPLSGSLRAGSGGPPPATTRPGGCPALGHVSRGGRLARLGHPERIFAGWQRGTAALPLVPAKYRSSPIGSSLAPGAGPH